MYVISFFNDNVYKMILHVFSSWVCELLDIMKISLSNYSLYLGITVIFVFFLQVV